MNVPAVSVRARAQARPHTCRCHADKGTPQPTLALEDVADGLNAYGFNTWFSPDAGLHVSEQLAAGSRV